MGVSEQESDDESVFGKKDSHTTMIRHRTERSTEVDLYSEQLTSAIGYGLTPPKITISIQPES